MATAATIFTRLALDIKDYEANLETAQKKASGFQTHFMGVGDALQTVGKLALTAAAAGFAALGAGVAIVGKQAFSMGVDMQNAMSLIAAKTGATGAELDSLGESFRTLYGNFPADTEEVSAAISMVHARMDLVGDDLDFVTGKFLDFARVNRLDVSSSVSYVTQAMQAMELGAGEAELMLDKLTKASQMSGISVEDLANGIIDAGPPFVELGYSLDDTIALFAQLEKAGARPREVISSLSLALNTLVQEQAKATGEVMTAEEAFADYMYRIENAEDYLESIRLANELFGARVGGKIADDIRAGRFEVSEWAEVIKGAGGTLSETADATLTFGDRLEMFKNKGRLALEPVGNGMLSIAETILDKLSPAFTTLMDKAMPIIESITTAVVTFVEKILDGENPLMSFKDLIQDLFGSELADKIIEIVDAVVEFGEKVWEFLEPVVEWISSNVELGDVLLVLGAAILSVIVPAIWSALVPILQVVVIIGALIGLVALLRTAWENDWLGIRTALTDAWENKLQPAFEAIKEWLGVTIPIVTAYLSDMWENTLKPAFETVWAFIQDKIVPIFQSVSDFLTSTFSKSTSGLSDLWENTLKPALETVWAFLKDHVFPIFEAIGDFLAAGFSLTLTILAGIWENVLYPALSTVWEFIKDYLMPIFEAIAYVWENVLVPGIEIIVGWLVEKLTPAFETLKIVLDAVSTFISNLAEGLNNLKDKLPAWLTPGSPTPFENGLRGIIDAMRELNSSVLPTFDAKIHIQEPTLLSGLGEITTAGGTHYHLTANYPMQSELSLIEQVRIQEALSA